MKHSYLFLLFLILTKNLLATDDAYILYNKDGKKSSYQKLLQAASKADIILFGELHNNPICHWMQLKLTSDLHAVHQDNLVLGAEMFEADDQLVLNEYLNDFISDKTFKEESKQWNNFNTDYKPLVDFAKKNNLPFIATNIPRRYANIVFKRGLASLDSIDKAALQWICPLPFAFDGELDCYKNISKAAMHGSQNMALAQAIKDATMAYFIQKNMNESSVFLHFNGSYHSNYHESIAWYLRKYFPEINIVVIASHEADNIEIFDPSHQDMGDYILYTPSKMTKTY